MFFTVGGKRFGCAELLFSSCSELPDRIIITVDAKCFRCAERCRIDVASQSLRTMRSLVILEIDFAGSEGLSGARVLVARSIFTVGAKRRRCTDVLIMTQISNRLRILTARRRNHHHSSRETLLLVLNSSVARKYRSSGVTGATSRVSFTSA